MGKKFSFYASVSKYAIPLLNIIDTKNICFFRLFREHCKIINTSFKRYTKAWKRIK